MNIVEQLTFTPIRHVWYVWVWYPYALGDGYVMRGGYFSEDWALWAQQRIEYGEGRSAMVVKRVAMHIDDNSHVDLRS